MLSLIRYDILLAVVVAISGLAFLVVRTSRRRLPYPPGPKRLPVVGNLFNMPSREESVTYMNWSKDCGSDVVHVDVLGNHMVILNSMKSANELLEKRTSIYSDRPPLKALQLFGILDFNLGFLPATRAWRRSRREFDAHLRPVDLESFRPTKQRAMHRLLRNLLSSPDQFARHLRHMPGQVIMSVAYGIDVQPEGDPYVEGAEKMMQAAAFGSSMEASLLDMIPWLIKLPSWLPGARFKRYAREWNPIILRAAKSPLDKVRRELVAGAATPSVAASTLSKLDKNSTEEEIWIAEAVPGTMYMASVDTSASSVNTFILAMTLYPEVQRRAQAEIDQVVGNSRLPNFSDEGALPYMQAVLKEVLRWHPAGPLGVPHRVTEDDVYEGYLIPEGSIIIPNVQAMMYDPEVFPEPEKFKPERWLAPDAPPVSYLNAVFGFGTRRCPGRLFANATMWLMMVGMLATFDITPTEDGPPEEIYMPGILSYVKPFRCYFRPRSEAAASLVQMTENEA
ncbi:cytochrome P450 [Lactarius quietus]|nr:cytochrome P450 [Lactarius quietus]